MGTGVSHGLLPDLWGHISPLAQSLRKLAKHWENLNREMLALIDGLRRDVHSNATHMRVDWGM